MNKEARWFWAYVTKYALTAGITLEKVRASSVNPRNAVTCGYPNNYLHGENREWHRSWESAKTRAEQMREAKIKSLRKQLAKVEAMKFVEPKEA